VTIVRSSILALLVSDMMRVGYPINMLFLTEAVSDVWNVIIKDDSSRPCRIFDLNKTLNYLGSMAKSESFYSSGSIASQLTLTTSAEPGEGSVILNLKTSLSDFRSAGKIFHLISTGLGPLLITLNSFRIIPLLTGNTPNL
jgi:hypothetical protein